MPAILFLKEFTSTFTALKMTVAGQCVLWIRKRNLNYSLLSCLNNNEIKFGIWSDSIQDVDQNNRIGLPSQPTPPPNLGVKPANSGQTWPEFTDFRPRSYSWANRPRSSTDLGPKFKYGLGIYSLTADLDVCLNIQFIGAYFYLVQKHQLLNNNNILWRGELKFYERSFGTTKPQFVTSTDKLNLDVTVTTFNFVIKFWRHLHFTKPFLVPKRIVRFNYRGPR